MERRVIQGPAARIVDALVGVWMGPDRLLALLTGCVSSHPSGLSGVRVGGLLRVDLADSRVYLVPADEDWRLRAAEFEDVLVDYRRIEGGWPREIELRRGPDVRLRLRVIELDRNPILPAALFQLTVPASYIHTPVDALDDERLLDSSDARVPVVPEG